MPKTLRARLRIRQGRRGRAVTLPEIVRYSRAIQPLAEHIGHWASGTGFQRGAKIIKRNHKRPASHGGLQTRNGCRELILSGEIFESNQEQRGLQHVGGELLRRALFRRPQQRDVAALRAGAIIFPQ